MQPRRQHSFQHDGDDLAGFVPPHEMVASSLMDTSNVNVSTHAAPAPQQLRLQARLHHGCCQQCTGMCSEQRQASSVCPCPTRLH
jgi:hypothetical protein